jgi:Transposase DDE domain
MRTERWRPGPLLRLALGRPWRQTEGLLCSITGLLGVNLAIPDHTTFFRRSVTLSLPTSLTPSRAPVPVARRDRFHRPEGLGGWRVARKLNSPYSGNGAVIVVQHSTQALLPLDRTGIST